MLMCLIKDSILHSRYSSFIYEFMFLMYLRNTRQNGENVNPFGAIASVAGDRSGPWTGWIGPVPV